MLFFYRIARFMALPLAFVMLLTGLSPVTKTKQQKLEAALAAEIEEDFVPVFRFAIASDVHIKTDDDTNARRFAKLFETAYRYCDAHPTYTALDAVLLAGDNCNTGADGEYEILNRVVKENMRASTQFVPIMGNHEFREGGHAGYERNMETPLDVHVVIKGFHIIGLSPSPESTKQTLKQANWMYGELKKAQADDPQKPIFTMQHGHIWNTVYVSRSWFTHSFFQLHAVYSQFPQVINFSGHSHGPINNPLSIWQNSYTQVGTGTMNYFEMESDITDETVPDNAAKAAQYTIVEVDAQNRVRMLPFDILTEDFIKTPSTTDDPDTQLIRQIDKPSDPSTFVYTSARKKTASVPWFDKDAAVTVRFEDAGKATVTFDRAEDNECVYAYRVELREADDQKNAVAVRNLYAEYYFEPIPRTQSCTFDGLEAGKAYVVSVTPMNVWLKEGTPITADFTAPTK
ncbi:MAG: metallophosphoesterase [Clostridia bacterium]|nr:metallophosphoesterase [Clostridia bacterium]